MSTVEDRNEITVFFAGDSGDGMQLAGSQFTETTAIFGNDTSTFPNFPAEIRAPQGTIAGVSGFQLKFGNSEVYTSGDSYDVLIAMNAAGLKSSISNLKKGGLIIANKDGFDKKNLLLAKYPLEKNPLTDGSLSNYSVYEVEVKKLTREILKGTSLSVKEIDRSKNMFVLGLLYWIYNRKIAHTLDFLKQKFGESSIIFEVNSKLLKAGYNFGDTAEFFSTHPRINVPPSKMPPGVYRNITGNQATALGLVAGTQKAKIKALYASYPITPASDILHELSKYKNYGLYTYQAEDEIAAICASIGASFGGSLGITASSGPGMALKGEGLGLAVSLELPLVIIDVQRGGPSTGLPTKTEQSDLNQALFGRNGEAPIPVLSAATSSDCFYMAFEACRIAIEFMTPVILLSDGYIGNASVPWQPPKSKELPSIQPKWDTKNNNRKGDNFLPYLRDSEGIRSWAIPGQKGLEHRIGGLEKEDKTGNVSYDAQNHELMTNLRAKKVENIVKKIPLQKIDSGKNQGKVLVLGWGSTYGTIRAATQEMIEKKWEVAHTHLKYMYPLPSNLGEIIKKFDILLIPELNKGQLIRYIRSEYLVDAIGLNKIQGLPFYKKDIIDKVATLLN